MSPHHEASNVPNSVLLGRAMRLRCASGRLSRTERHSGFKFEARRPGVFRVVLARVRVNYGRPRTSTTLAHIFQLRIGLQSRAAHKSAAPAWW